VGEFKSIWINVLNRSEKSVVLELIIQPYQETVNGGLDRNLSEKLLYLGSLRNFAPKLAVGESYQHELKVCFISAGRFSFNISVHVHHQRRKKHKPQKFKLKSKQDQVVEKTSSESDLEQLPSSGLRSQEDVSDALTSKHLYENEIEDGDNEDEDIYRCPQPIIIEAIEKELLEKL